MTTITLAARAAKEKVSSVSLPRVNWKAIYLIGILMSLLMVVSYIFLVNQLTEGVYLIKKYNKEVNALYSQNEVLENSFAQTDFLEEVMLKTRELSFEKTKDIKYLQIIQSPLAKAD